MNESKKHQDNYNFTNSDNNNLTNLEEFSSNKINSSLSISNYKNFLDNITLKNENLVKKYSLSNKNYYNINIFSILLNTLQVEKSESEKIKILILIEKEISKVKDKNNVYTLVTLLSNYYYDIDNFSTNIFRGQILITLTSILIIYNYAELLPNLFINFVNNVLIENIKNINDFKNIYIREISLYCLQEIETEYPGILFNLLGSKIEDVLSNSNNNNVSNNPNENKSIAYSLAASNIIFYNSKSNDFYFGKNSLSVNDKIQQIESKLIIN